MDRNLFFHILINLIKNALDATNDKIDSQIRIWLEKGQSVNRICIEDNGEGISKEDLLQIFERFFTQKQSGTGLGLAFVKEVMESFDGYVECESKVGEFTKFTLVFPRV